MATGPQSRASVCPQCKLPNDAMLPFCKRCGFDLDYFGGAVLTQIKCDYCNYIGKLSEEHVFGDWLRRKYPRKADKRLFSHARPDKLGFMLESVMSEQRKIKMSAPYDTVVCTVCKRCNEGWLSGLHKQASSTLVTFASDLWPRLSDQAANEMSRWAVMIMNNIEAESRIRTITEQQRQQLKNGAIPDGFQVSIGRMRDAIDAGSAAQHPSMLWFEDVENNGVMFQSTFFIVETLAFHIASASSNQRLRYCLANYDLDKIRLPRMIWPKNEQPSFGSRRRRFTQQELFGMHRGIRVGPHPSRAR